MPTTLSLVINNDCMSENIENTKPKQKEYNFKPWVSWNPAWRPKWARNVATIFREAIEKIEKDQKIEDVERDLVTVVIAKAKKGDLKAMEMYFDRVYWKPKQSIETTTIEAKPEMEMGE